MTEAFTPGPWQVEFQEKWPFDIAIKPDIAILGRYAYGSKDKSLEDVRGANSFSWEDRDEISAKVAEQEANACLIAAAPDLLQALENLVAWKDATEIIAPELGGLLRAFYHAEAAIMKARGKS